MNKPVQRPYRAYLLRFWAESNDDAWLWRVAVQRVGESERSLGFTSFSEAIEYLQKEIAGLTAELNQGTHTIDEE